MLSPTEGCAGTEAAEPDPACESGRHPDTVCSRCRRPYVSCITTDAAVEWHRCHLPNGAVSEWHPMLSLVRQHQERRRMALMVHTHPAGFGVASMPRSIQQIRASAP